MAERYWRLQLHRADKLKLLVEIGMIRKPPPVQG